MADTNTARDTLIELLQGVERFNTEVFPQNRELFASLAESQSPDTLFIACADSRVNPSMITQTQPGDLFVLRNIGNIVPAYGEMLGGVSSAIEYAVSALKVSHIIVCGHSNCGAMKALLDPDPTNLNKMPTVASWLRNAEAARAVLEASDAGPATVRSLAEQNVQLQIAHLRTHPAVAAGLARGTLTLQGWFYDIASGEVVVLDETSRQFVHVDEAIARLRAQSGYARHRLNAPTGMGVWLALFACLTTMPPGPAQAAASLKLSTWNLDWLTTRTQGDAALPPDVTPRTPAELDALARYARHLAPDIAALEEVDTPELAARLFPAPFYHIIISGDQVVQKVALAIRADPQVERHADVTALDVYPATAPRHLRSGLDLSIGSGPDTLRLLVVHLKAGCRDSSPTSRKPACRTLLRQIAVIQDWIMERQDEGEAFAVLGDFNRLLAPDDPALRNLAENGPLTLATAGHASPCGQGSYFIDHIILGGAARGWLQPDSLRVMLYRDSGREQAMRLSDHCPVSVRLSPP